MVLGIRGATVRRSIGVLLSVVVLAGCAEGPPITPRTSAVQASVEPPSPDPSLGPGPSATPGLTPAPQASPIAGVWRVRRALAPGDRGALVPTTAYGDEAYDVKPQCPTEPCDRIEIRATPLGFAEPVTVTVLERDANTYVSPATSGEGPCVNDDGDRVPGGAAVRSSLRVWVAAVRQTGTAVDITELTGRLEILLTPTAIGEASGCTPQTASYDLSGRRERVAVRGDDPGETPPPGAALVALPSIGIKVAGSAIDYFAVHGDTVNELAAAVSRGGVKACGEIEYEWFRGDARPSACTATRFADLDRAIVTSGDPSRSACTIRRATIGVAFTIHFPRWTRPDRVPAPLLRWWREIVTFIRDHEAGHVDISRAQVKTLNARLTGAKCSATSSIIRKWAGQFSAAQEAFDRREYQRPWPVPPPGY